jgi:anti-anti-sigma regulatory factor
MAATQGCIRVRQQDRTVYFQVEGWGTMQRSLSFRFFAERCLAQGAAALRVDLRHCTYLGSTFLGMLIGLKRAASSLGQDSFALVIGENDSFQPFSAATT